MLALRPVGERQFNDISGKYNNDNNNRNYKSIIKNFGNKSQKHFSIFTFEILSLMCYSC